MVDEPAEQARRALVALANACPAGDDTAGPGSIPLDWFRWLPLPAVNLLAPTAGVSFERSDGTVALAAFSNSREQVEFSIERHFGEGLAAVDHLRLSRTPLQLGWLFVAGTATVGGRSRKVFWPLVTRPVSISVPPLVGPAVVVPAGDLQLTARIEDPAQRLALEHHIEWGGGAFDAQPVSAPVPLLARLPRLYSFASDAAKAAGFDAVDLVPGGADPDELQRHDGLVIVAGVAVFASDETGGLSQAASLRAWASQPLTRWTAFHSLYTDDTREHDLPPSTEKAESPFLLTPVQRAAVAQSRHAAVTVIKGAPGTGKSHTVTAIACDALARGDSVLVAAKSEATVDALIELFERAPGPRPVVFGSNERKNQLAEHLAGGLRASEADALARAADALTEAVATRDAQRQSIIDRLQRELLHDRPHVTDAARSRWPMLFAPDADLDVVLHLVGLASAPARDRTSRRVRRRAARSLDELGGARTDAERADFVAALLLARGARDIAGHASDGDEVIGRDWEALRAADDEAHRRAAQWLELHSRAPERLNRASLSAVAELATALRSGRAIRRAQLARMDDHLIRALPLWAGTLADIDDLLPSVAGLFDIVILDEASSIDQATAAAALLRGSRAVIVGDPKQLRHVSFLSDERRDQAIIDAGIDPGSPLAARLDVRRNSTFDVASGAAPVLTLDEHFRCRPHLVEFVTRRLYDGQVQVATRSPATASVDCVELERVDGDRDKTGVVQAEIDAIVTRLHQLRARGARSVGVVTPFRAQADALEAAVLRELSLADIDALGLRVGTVHAFQGIERDVVIASLGIGADASAGSWRFVEDPHLFTVFVTRARKQFVIVHAADPRPGGLAADYFAQADRPPGPPAPVEPFDPWAAAIAQRVTAAGAHNSLGYPTGRHVVDLCLTDGSAFTGIECTIHPDGPAAHVERHLSLIRRGWPLREAFRSGWGDRIGELVVELTVDPVPGSGP